MSRINNKCSHLNIAHLQNFENYSEMDTIGVSHLAVEKKRKGSLIYAAVRGITQRNAFVIFFIASFSSIDQATLLFRARVSMYSRIWLKRGNGRARSARTGNAALVNHD